MGRKSRHVRDESDPLLGYYSQQLGSSVRNQANPLYAYDASASPPPPYFSPSKKRFESESSSFSSFEDSPEKQDAATKNGDNNFRKPLLVSFREDDEQQKQHKQPPSVKTKKKKKGYRVHRVSYTAHDHIQVMFRLYGSAFPNVFPFVVVNVMWCLLVYGLKKMNLVDWTFHSSVGHSFMGLLVSFLIVSRSQIAYGRFMEYRKLLSSCYSACREIAQFTTVYTNYTNTPAAQQWRREVCYRTILMLRVTMDALLWSSTERDHWEDEYYQYQLSSDSSPNHSGRQFGTFPSTSSITEEDDEEHGNNNSGQGIGYNSMQTSQGESENVSEHFFRFRQLTHGRRSQIDENCRAPFTSMHVLRDTIMDHPQYLGYKMAVNEYRDLLNFVTKFDDAYHGFRVLVFTPYPFPLVQMTRGFLFFWVYTLPLVLLVDYRVWPTLLIIILVTFGFVGIEYVSMALEDPFADDTNDIDEHGMALLVYEDIYMALYRTDGPAAAETLREQVLARYKKGRALDCYREDLKGYDLWETAYSRHTRLGQSPDWSRNPPPIVPASSSPPSPPPQRQPSNESQPRSRRPPTHPSLNGNRSR